MTAYTAIEMQAMSLEELNAAAARGWQKPDDEDRPAYAGIPLGSSVPEPTSQPSADVWSRRKSEGTDFTCPSGQTCKLRKVQPEDALRAGILDRITRLDGLAADLVARAEGAPPEPNKLPSGDDIAVLLETINSLTLLAVAEPKIYADDDSDAPEGAIRISDIELEDRMAIMEKALEGLKSLDRFRKS